jgi:hypothetical protein
MPWDLGNGAPRQALAPPHRHTDAGPVPGAAFRVTGRLSVCVLLHHLDDFSIFGTRAVAAMDKARSEELPAP